MEAITQAMNNNIPKRKINYFKHSPVSDYIRILEMMYETINGWDWWIL